MKPINIKSRHILRGISWNYFAGACRAGHRPYYFFLGFLPVARYVRGKKR